MHRPPDLVAQLTGERQRVLLVARAVVAHRELVARDPGEVVTARDARLQALREGDEELVAGGVPERVVHLGELLDADAEHHRLAAQSRHARERGFEAVEEQPPVGEAGHVVVEGVEREILLQALS